MTQDKDINKLIVKIGEVVATEIEEVSEVRYIKDNVSAFEIITDDNSKYTFELQKAL